MKNVTKNPTALWNIPNTQQSTPDTAWNPRWGTPLISRIWNSSWCGNRGTSKFSNDWEGLEGDNWLYHVQIHHMMSMSVLIWRSGWPKSAKLVASRKQALWVHRELALDFWYTNLAWWSNKGSKSKKSARKLPRWVSQLVLLYSDMSCLSAVGGARLGRRVQWKLQGTKKKDTDRWLTIWKPLRIPSCWCK